MTEQIVRDADRPATAASGKIKEKAPKTKVEAKEYQRQIQNTLHRYSCLI
mgnify:CR=1 FL=1